MLRDHPPPDVDTTLSVSPRGLVGALKVGILIFAVIVAFGFLVYLVSSRFHLEFDATFWTAAGLVLLSFTLIRPWWFWYHPKALFVRSLITDTGATLLYVALTGSIIVTGVRRQVAITRARHACAQGLASAKNVHERVRVLYGQGVDSLPRSEDEPRSFRCERLLEQD